MTLDEMMKLMESEGKSAEEVIQMIDKSQKELLEKADSFLKEAEEFLDEQFLYSSSISGQRHSYGLFVYLFSVAKRLTTT